MACYHDGLGFHAAPSHHTLANQSTLNQHNFAGDIKDLAPLRRRLAWEISASAPEKICTPPLEYPLTCFTGNVKATHFSKMLANCSHTPWEYFAPSKSLPNAIRQTLCFCMMFADSLIFTVFSPLAQLGSHWANLVYCLSKSLSSSRRTERVLAPQWLPQEAATRMRWRSRMFVMHSVAVNTGAPKKGPVGEI